MGFFGARNLLSNRVRFTTLQPRLPASFCRRPGPPPQGLFSSSDGSLAGHGNSDAGGNGWGNTLQRGPFPPPMVLGTHVGRMERGGISEFMTSG